MNPTPSTLPEMSRHEASWHEHVAGMRAADHARHEGGDPAATAALATATAGTRQIGPFTVRPASQGTVWALRRIAREWQVYADARNLPSTGDPTNPGTRELIELGLAVLAFCDARATWLALDNGELASLVSRAEDMMWNLPVEIQMQLQAHFTGEMDRIKDLTPGEEENGKKPQPQPAAAGSSPVAQTPPAAADSPHANGSLPNTDFR